LNNKIAALKKKVFNKELVGSTLVRLVTVISGLFVSILTSRVLGPSERGLYFLFTTIALTIAQFCNLGLQTSNVYAVTKDKALLPKIESNSFFVSYVLTPFIGLIAFIILRFSGVVTSSDPMIVISLLLLAASNVYYLIAGNLFVSLDCVYLYNRIHLFSNLFGAMLITAALLFYKNFQHVLFATALASFCVSILISFLLFKKSRIKIWRFDYELFKENFPLSLKVYLSCAVSFFMLKGNVFFLQYFSGEAAIGYYSIASQINDTLCILPSVLGFLLYPKLINSPDDRWKITKENLLFFGGLMGIICFISWALAPVCVNLLFGHSFSASIPIINAMLPGVVLYALISILSQYLASTDYPRMQVYVWFFGLVFSASLNYLLIPLLKGVGAAMSLSLTYLFMFVFLLILALRMKREIVKNQELKVARI
jgi:O-antigen/teichoic acid export membrane protein